MRNEEFDTDNLASQMRNLMTGVNFRPFNSILKNIVRNSIEENFMQGGRFGSGIFGGGLTKWQTSRRATGQSGMTLQDSGQLAASIRVNVDFDGNDFNIEAGSSKPYAAIQQLGGSVDIPVTAKSRRFFWYMHMKERKKAVRDLRKIYKSRGTTLKKKDLQQQKNDFFTPWMGMALSKKDRFHFKLPARPYLVLQQEDFDLISEQFLIFLSQRLK